jgi:hypothetical protein
LSIEAELAPNATPFSSSSSTFDLSRDADLANLTLGEVFDVFDLFLSSRLRLLQLIGEW